MLTPMESLDFLEQLLYRMTLPYKADDPKAISHMVVQAQINNIRRVLLKAMEPVVTQDSELEEETDDNLVQSN